MSVSYLCWQFPVRRLGGDIAPVIVDCGVLEARGLCAGALDTAKGIVHMGLRLRFTIVPEISILEHEWESA